MVEEKKKAVVILSGGLDCTGYLAFYTNWEIHALTFIYGQKTQEKEIETAKKIVKMFPNIISHKIIDISFMKELFGEIQLTNNDTQVQEEYSTDIIVPLRNAIFSTIAASYAYSNNMDAVLLGSHIDDAKWQDNTHEPLFPDCTPEFFEALTMALHLGHFRLGKKVEIFTASGDGLSKADLAYHGHAILGDKIFDTWSCYKRNDYQCGVCLSCRVRKKAFKDAKVKDKTIYKNPGQEVLKCVE
jgi:7-cyano-7-deazaguanine synthase